MCTSMIERMQIALNTIPQDRCLLPDRRWLDQAKSIGASVYISGWQGLIDDMLLEIEEAIAATDARLELRQLKEKLGKLRFYYRLDHASDSQVAAIKTIYEKAVERSATTCIACGAAAEIALHGGWIAPLCERHARLRREGLLSL